MYNEKLNYYIDMFFITSTKKLFLDIFYIDTFSRDFFTKILNYLSKIVTFPQILTT